jgi:hypothetical protein
MFGNLWESLETGSINLCGMDREFAASLNELNLLQIFLELESIFVVVSGKSLAEGVDGLVERAKSIQGVVVKLWKFINLVRQ